MAKKECYEMSNLIPMHKILDFTIRYLLYSTTPYQDLTLMCQKLVYAMISKKIQVV
jgi:hypothetical protein